MTITISLAELATQIGAELEGASKTDLQIIGVASLKQAGKQEISFFSNRLFKKELLETQAAAVIIAFKNQQLCQNVPKLLMDNPYLGYAVAAALLNPPIRQPPGIHPSAWVSPEACLDATVSVAPQAVIEADVKVGSEVEIGPGCVIQRGVEIGNQSRLVANVTLCTGTKLGQRVIIHPGAVIGADGFGNANDNGKWVKIPQLGGVTIGNDVEIGANTTIDKGALDDTTIGNGVRLDNQIQIGHNVQVGEHTAMAGCVGIAGSTCIGSYCLIGGDVGIAGHLEIVDHVQITGGSKVMQSIREPGVYSSGTPLEPNQRWHKNYHRLKSLDDMARRLKKLGQAEKK
ncbi:MAG: UDP-3-O-(3-hydroxymyristoyl)glucosamine N-acyltransferase [Candidatus Parabeggiatoa sp. nov. 3]|nr:MAG: UDP-3-O-(3-hydroxymyristoyl)glucosamine N-acyltransferase [Gammaproteobacteria bacterium]RKZ68976.1 MAG: UDP-3-O-(3-hydroxymyristoyl)glucosamine N-acyltransferase [Gammaproteobacteria bacterium]HEW98490.1 UDP-3-O-(3-hydroxymyristoyl)glucosamine N-acyltransferase [Beggiatoa sp.]